MVQTTNFSSHMRLSGRQSPRPAIVPPLSVSFGDVPPAIWLPSSTAASIIIDWFLCQWYNFHLNFSLKSVVGDSFTSNAVTQTERVVYRMEECKYFWMTMTGFSSSQRVKGNVQARLQEHCSLQICGVVIKSWRTFKSHYLKQCAQHSNEMNID